MLDRDFSGTQVSQHGAGGYANWSPSEVYHHTACPNAAYINGNGFNTVFETISQPGTDGIFDGANTFQGARAYDPATHQWTAPDAYAGDVHDPMSQKPYMWNHNNPISYVDPSGYYVCDNCTAAQQKALDNSAQALDKKVQKAMSSTSPKSSEYKALEALHEDLQKGKGNWHIQFGPSGDKRSPGYTSVSSQGTGSGFKITGVGATVLDQSVLKNNTPSWLQALAQEGGIYEMATGRAGSAAKAQFTGAHYIDNVVDDMLGRTDIDSSVDRVVDRWYNRAIGVRPDDE